MSVCSTPPRKRARVEITPQIKKEICQFKQSKPNITQNEIITFVREKFCVKIGRSTISDILKESSKWIAVSSSDTSTSRSRKPHQEELENALFLWFSDVRKRNIMLNDELLKTQAKVLGDKLGVEDFSYSTGWLYRFKLRHGIKMHKVHGESASVSLELVKEGRESLQEVLLEYNPCDIFNCDETGLLYKIEPNSTLSTVPVSGKKQAKDRLTVMLTCNATGTEKLKPLVIHKYNTPRCFGRSFDPTSVCHWYVNKKAWMTSLIFKAWLLILDRQMRLERRHVILLLDNAPSHATVDTTNVKCHFLPPNTTVHIQPLDAGIIKNFKLYYKKQQMKLHLDNVEAEEIQPLDVKRALLFIRAAWNEVKQDTIINCWRHTRILPDATATMATAEPVIADLEAINAINATFNTMYGDTALSEGFLTADDDIPCEEELTNDTIVDIVRGQPDDVNTDNTEDEADDSEDPIIPPAATIKAHLTQLACFVEHHLDVFSITDLDFITKMQGTLRNVSKCEKQKTLKDYFKKMKQVVKTVALAFTRGNVCR
ncbi:tigger transposable element-derived protein 6-like [Haliotis rufescens]|uniref:tigger transposable element-derived protein 6-like n=1 Tax=Haliotis rufescens TaxID=6454 RepID=UPI00201F2CC5|nr:tigger transposable element-derived protein 6-like [Haliotis rufescens]